MTEKGTSGIEKLRSFADDAAEFIRDVADQIELRHQLDVDAAVEETEDELADRLMPEGLEWPRFEDGEPIAHGDAPDDIAAVMVMLDGSGYELIDMPDYAVRPRGERVKRPEPEAIGADGLPIKIGDTVYLESFGRPFTVVGFDGAYLKDADGGYLLADCATHTPPDTQERIDADATISSYDYLIKHGKHDETRRRHDETRRDTRARMRAAKWADIMRRQRELDVRTMGGAE